MYRLIGILALAILSTNNAIDGHWLAATGWALIFVAAILESVEWAYKP